MGGKSAPSQPTTTTDMGQFGYTTTGGFGSKWGATPFQKSFIESAQNRMNNANKALENRTVSQERVQAMLFTREGDSLNQKAVNLHMLEDVLGWAIVLIGAVIMRFTDIAILDPLLSIAVAVFILINAAKNLGEIFDLLLEKAPHGIDIDEIKEHLLKIDGVYDIHHVHVWSMDGQNNYATMHIVTNGEPHEIKENIRSVLREHGIGRVTLELEAEHEHCHEEHCTVKPSGGRSHHHHHH